MTQNSNLFLSIGKPVKDEYGRLVGKIAAFALTPNGKFDTVFIEHSNGKFTKQPMEHFTFNGAEITFISTIKLQANIFCDQIPLIWRKDQALKELAEKRKISQELYTELHTNFESILTQLKKDAQLLTDEIIRELSRCDEDTKMLSYATVNLELEHEIGQIDEASYKSAFTILQENLKRINAEKNDLEQTKTKLSNIMLGDSLPLTEPTQKSKVFAETITEPTDLPEPPVVVYVKEIGKAGI